MAVGVAAGGGRILDPQEWKEISFSSKEEEKWLWARPRAGGGSSTTSSPSVGGRSASPPSARGRSASRPLEAASPRCSTSSRASARGHNTS